MSSMIETEQLTRPMPAQGPAAGLQERLSIQLNAFPEYRELAAWFDPNTKTVWCMTRPNGPLHYTDRLLDELHDVADHIERFCQGSAGGRPKFLVTGSDVPAVYNLGGDLDFFTRCMRNGDRKNLLTYAVKCVSIVHRSLVNFNTPIVSIGLAQGDALGGGLEAALTFNFLVAEKSARFGFPEVLFNSFPGMGAYSILTSRIGSKLAEKIIFSGKIYTAEEFQAFGLIDVVVEDGNGMDAVHQLIKQNEKRTDAIAAINEIRRKFRPIHLEELIAITEKWVDVVMQLEPASLRKMEFLIKAQRKLDRRA